MKTISAALNSHFGQDSMTLTCLWKLTREDGTIMGFTTHDQAVVYAGVTYQGDTGMTSTATALKSDMSVDNMSVTAFLDSNSMTENDVRAGLYDNARVDIYIVNWADL